MCRIQVLVYFFLHLFIVTIFASSFLTCQLTGRVIFIQNQILIKYIVATCATFACDAASSHAAAVYCFYVYLFLYDMYLSLPVI